MNEPVMKAFLDVLTAVEADDYQNKSFYRHTDQFGFPVEKIDSLQRMFIAGYNAALMDVLDTANVRYNDWATPPK